MEKLLSSIAQEFVLAVWPVFGVIVYTWKKIIEDSFLSPATNLEIAQVHMLNYSTGT